MSDHKTRQIFDQAKRDVRLGEHEFHDRKQRVWEFMENNPPVEPTRWYHRIFSLRLITSPVPYAATLLVFVMVGGGISYAAQDAMPGDALYPVKVSINEELQGYLYHNTPQQNAMFEARRASQRLAEGTALTNSGQLDANELTQISDNLDAHIGELRNYIRSKKDIKTPATSTTERTEQTAATTSDSSVGTTTATTSPQQATSTQRHASGTATTSQDEPDGLSVTTTERAQDTDSSTTSEDTATQTHATTSEEESVIAQHKKRSRQEIKQMQEHITGTSTSLASEKKASVKQRLQKAQRTFEKGVEHLRAERYQQALQKFSKAQRTVNKVKRFLHKHSDAAVKTLEPEEPVATSTSATSSAPDSLQNAGTSTAATSSTSTSASTTATSTASSTTPTE